MKGVINFLRWGAGPQTLRSYSGIECLKGNKPVYKITKTNEERILVSICILEVTDIFFHSVNVNKSLRIHHLQHKNHESIWMRFGFHLKKLVKS